MGHLTAGEGACGSRVVQRCGPQPWLPEVGVRLLGETPESNTLNRLHGAHCAEKAGPGMDFWVRIALKRRVLAWITGSKLR